MRYSIFTGRNNKYEHDVVNVYRRILFECVFHLSLFIRGLQVSSLRFESSPASDLQMELAGITSKFRHCSARSEIKETHPKGEKSKILQENQKNLKSPRVSSHRGMLNES